MPEASIYKKFEDATRRYYGADKDPLKFVPPISKADIAQGIANQVKGQLEAITDEELTDSANRIHQRDRYSRPKIERTLDELKEEALQDRLAMIVVNAEMQHAHEAPGDFNEDSERSTAYEMGIGIPTPQRPEPPSGPRYLPPPR